MDPILLRSCIKQYHWYATNGRTHSARLIAKDIDKLIRIKALVGVNVQSFVNLPYLLESQAC